MKNQINLLSNNSQFFNEDKFVFKLGTIASAQNKQPVDKMNRREVAEAYENLFTKRYKDEARRLCRKSASSCSMLKKKERHILGKEKKYRDNGNFYSPEPEKPKDAKSEISRIWNNNREFPGRKSLFKTLRYKIADAGLGKVTDKEVSDFVKRWQEKNPGKYISTGQAKPILQKNKREKVAKAVGDFLNRNPDFRDRVLIKLYAYVVRFKEIKNAQKVITKVKNRLMRNRKLMAYLPNLKPKSTVVAGAKTRRKR